MAEVPASTFITADKMSGIGPAKIKLTAAVNELAEEKIAKITVKSGDQSKDVSIRQEPGPIVVIPEFDFLVLRYSWEENAGTDFDTATGFTNTGIADVDNKFVGWSKQYQTTQEEVGDYLIHGGDNMMSGQEAALIQMKPLLSAPGLNESETDIELAIYGNWYGEKGTGNVTVSFTAYLGGTMQKTGFNFVNNGGEEVYSDSVTTNIAATGEDNWQNITGLYSKVGTMLYNKEDRDCIILVGQ